MKARDLIESIVTENRGASNRVQILRKLGAVGKRRSLSAHVAQMHLSPFGPVPSYAYDDPASSWWSSPEADALLQELTDMLAPNTTYGVKAPTPERPGRPGTAEWPPLSGQRIDPKWTLDD